MAQVSSTPLFCAIQKLQEVICISCRTLATSQDGRYHHVVCVCVYVYQWNIVIRCEFSHNTQRNLLLQVTKHHTFNFLHPVITSRRARTCEVGEKIAAFTFRSVIMNCQRLTFFFWSWYDKVMAVRLFPFASGWNQYPKKHWSYKCNIFYGYVSYTYLHIITFRSLSCENSIVSSKQCRSYDLVRPRSISSTFSFLTL